MSEAITGALVGGIIGIAGSLLVMLFEHRRQNSDRRISFLRESKVELERLYEGMAKTLSEGLSTGRFDVGHSMDAIYRCPSSVRDAYLSAMKAASNDEKATGYQNMVAAMKQSLVEMDKAIFQELGGK